jgi:uncharacterized protein YjbJ (UPF0337 family)
VVEAGDILAGEVSLRWCFANGPNKNLNVWSDENTQFKEEDAMKPSTKDQVKGKFHEVKGKIKEKVGKATNNPNLENEGTNEKTVGKVQKKIGQVEKVLED